MWERRQLQRLKNDPAGVVMSTIPVQTIADSLKDASLGTIDCYTQANGRLFKNRQSEVSVR
mgnify:CR=1 FL=1